MSNLSIKVNLTKLPGAIFQKLTGKSGTKKDCIIIPIEDCNLFVGEKGVYLDLTAYGYKEQKYSDTHFVKQSFSKEQIESIKELALIVNPTLSDAELKEVLNKANPIIGGVKPLQKAEIQPVQESALNPQDDDLPF